MASIFELIENKTENWISQEKTKSQSAIGLLIKHIEKESKLREPQKKAIEVYLWLKFIGQNQKLADIIRKGLLYDESKAQEYDNFYTFGNNYTAHFLNQFFQDNKAQNLQKKLANDPHGKTENWDKVLDQLLHNLNYSNYLFSLPMGAGKTYLMACFIYLDLYFANLYPNDKRFAHNFIVLAPQASKTAILPSLQTIKNFNPEWLLPKAEADRLKQIIQIEILDALSSKRRDKLQGNNPNLEKTNRLLHTKDFGLVFITNAEKVVLERYNETDKNLLLQKSFNFNAQKETAEIVKSNELRERLSQIPFLSIILDEVHHTYGKDKSNQEAEKKLRQAVNTLNQNNNTISVLGFSGTPYVRHTVAVDHETIRLNQIQDIVYNYPLNQGIGLFLKVPEIKSENIKEKSFIKNALTEFFNNYDINYPNGTKSKMAFYCPSIKKLNDDILSIIKEWYQENRPTKTNEIFSYYSNPTKDNKQYTLPKDSLAIFNNLDKPYSDKRVVLLVAVGTEGWDCKSLTAVVLPRQKTTKNFVLQTTCRCLREVENASQEKALIYLEKENYQTLDKELKENYNLKITDLKLNATPSIAVKIRKPKLGKLKYQQISKKYKLITKTASQNKNPLKDFNFELIKQKYPYQETIRRGKIGQQGLTAETDLTRNTPNGATAYDLADFLYDLSQATFGQFSEIELWQKWPKELETTFEKIKNNWQWLANNPNLEVKDISQYLVSLLMPEVEYQSEIITEAVEIELLEWQTNNPQISLYTTNGGLFKFMPPLNSKDALTYSRHPEDLEEDFFSQNNNIDPQDISFNYIPYRMDSDFERNALKEMLRISELKGLEVYWNGYQNQELQSFYIKTTIGVYTPDFLILKRANNQKQKGEISKILIVETKGRPFYDNEFRAKEKFVKEEFIKYNPHFSYTSFVDEKGDNNFSGFLDELKNKIKTL